MRILLLIVIIFSFSCREEKRYQDVNLTEYQRQINNYFKDASVSPLKPKDLKNFQGLDFFEFDSIYVVKAKIEETKESLPFKMKTTTDIPADVRKYADLFFQIIDKEFELSVYENLEYEGVEGYENYLFLPFLDETNENETYGGGRYLDLFLNGTDSIIIDFNKAYNPKCVYDENFSCPIVPRKNFLNTRIEAGVKNFIKN
ncbi:MAG: DUF1684 domain-containing protein [Flavobacteriaceae bacterium]|nr:DUF1684 domain-containing protein [Flavobacteriaceae bacterium]